MWIGGAEALPTRRQPKVMDVVVGVIGRAHGIRGEVSVRPRTDEPATRFAAGQVLCHGPGRRDRLTVRSARSHGGRLLVGFEEVDDRSAAELLRGAELVLDVADDDRPTDPDEFYDHQLVGIAVRTTGGDPVGSVVEVRHLPAQDMLVIEGEGGTYLVPFVAALVPEVDVGAGTLTVDPRPGLLDPVDGNPLGAG